MSAASLPMGDIFARDKAGEVITRDNPDLGKIMDVIFAAQKLIAELNTSFKTQEEVRTLFSKLTGVEVDPSFCLLPPFYTDFGRNIRVGNSKPRGLLAIDHQHTTRRVGNG